MHTRAPRRWLPVALAWLGLAMFAVITPAFAEQPRVQSLFETSPGSAPFPAERAVTRSRNVAPALGLIHQAIAALRLKPSVPVLMQADFFLDAPLTLRFERAELMGDGTEALVGGVEGDPLGSVVLVAKGSIVSANVVANRRTFQLRSRGHSVHEVREIDTRLLGESPPALESPPAKAFATTPISAGMMTDDGSLIDVLVLYTSTARAAAGSIEAIESQVSLAVAETNAAYANSGVNQRIRLVFTTEVSYAEAGDLRVDLQRLMTAGDGQLDEAQGLRDTFGADIVSLWVENNAGVCALSNQLTSANDSTFAPSAYNVVGRTCVTTEYQFAHELGHSMGLRHDLYDDNANTPFPYAHGYVDLTHAFRTVMAVRAQCLNAGGADCPRIQYFSNPTVNYSGFVTGNSTANAASVLNQTAFTVANFRASVPPAGRLGFSPASYIVSEAGGAVVLTVARTEGTAGTVSVQYTTVDGTASAGSDYTATTGTLTWGPGDAGTKTIVVPILNDAVNEGNETFTVSLGNATGGAIIIAPTATVLVIESQAEVFPRNCAMPIGWTVTTGATTGWSVSSTDTSVEGSCTLRSNPIGDSAGIGQYSKAQIEFTGTFLAGNVTFSRRVSSEQDWDCLRFLVDGVQKDIAAAQHGCGTVNYGTGGLGASGEDPWAAISIPITSGTHTIRWSFERDQAWGDGANTAWIDNVVLPMAASTTTLASSANPSASGQAVTFTATVTGGTGTPAGTVLFKADGTTLPGCAAVNLSFSATATCSTSAFSVGTHAVTAEYSGSNVYKYSVSSPLTQTVNPVGPTLTSVASRKNHAGAGPLDVTILTAPPVTGAVSVESRVGSGGSHSIVFTFGAAITSAGSVSATDAGGAPIGTASALASGNQVIVSLGSIPASARVKVTLTGVNGAAGSYAASMGFLVGDVIESRAVDTFDVDAVKAQSGTAAIAGNARHDLDLSGAITSADILRTKGRVGSGI